MGLVYLGWIVTVGRRLPQEEQRLAIAPLAMLAFNLAYGIVLSMLEDQMSALFIGAAAGMLWQLRETARAGRWSDPYLGRSRDWRHRRFRPPRQFLAAAQRGRIDTLNGRIREQLYPAARCCSR